MNKAILLTAALLILVAPSAFGDDIDYDKIFDAVNPVLVSVEYRAEMNFMGQSDDIEGRVMGIAVEPQGMIIFDGTSLAAGAGFGDGINVPRVEKPKSIKITDYKGDTYQAEYIGVDQFTTIAFCRLPDSLKGKIKGAELKKADFDLGDDIIIAWLLPREFEPRFQLAETVITGMLEKPEKYYLTGELNSDFVMTPVLSAAGEFVGVVTTVPFRENRRSFDAGAAFGSPVGIMPVDRFRELLNKPPAADQFQRGWLGIALQALDPEVAEFWNVSVPGGIIVSDVIPHSPAARAGLEPGDFIIALDSDPIDIKDDASMPVFQKSISERGAGGTMDFTVVRPGDNTADTLSIAIVLDERPVSAGDAPSYEDKNFDLTLRDLVFDDYNVRDLDPDELDGVVIDKMEPGGWASVDGLRAGDIVLKINDREVTAASECEEIFAEIEKEKRREAVFMVWRFNKTQFVIVKTHWE
jgi:serine protease Do